LFAVVMSVLELVSSVLYYVMMGYLSVGVVRTMMKEGRKYGLVFWSYVDVVLLVSSWCCLGLLVWKNVRSSAVGEEFGRTNGYAYVNVRGVVYVESVHRWFLSMSCFCACVKGLRLCRYDRRMSYFGRTLLHAGRELMSFGMMYSVVFVSFMCLFYFLFVSDLRSCASVFSTAQMLFEMTLMKFDAHELIAAQPVLGPLSFGLFILLVVFVCMSMFVGIISDHFRRVRDGKQVSMGSLEDGEDDEKVISWLYARVRRYLSIGKSKKKWSMSETSRAVGVTYMNPVDIFPSKVDELLDGLLRVSGMRGVDERRMFYST
jgi:hypothetical protein